MKYMILLISFLSAMLLGCDQSVDSQIAGPNLCDESDRVVMDASDYRPTDPNPPDWIIILETTCTDLEDETIIIVSKKILTYLQKRNEYIADGFNCRQKSYMCHSETMQRIDYDVPPVQE